MIDKQTLSQPSSVTFTDIDGVLIDDRVSCAKQAGISSQFNGDIDRASRFSFRLGEIFFDFSKTHINQALLQHYLELAADTKLCERREKMFSGAPINLTEGRSVLHTLLRETDHDGIELLNPNDKLLAQKTQACFLEKIDSIRAKFLDTGVPIKNIVHIGIGGSSLGPQLLFEALAGFDNKVKVYFIDNIDAHQILAVLNECQPESTLVFGVSKTFTTEETLININTVKDWYATNQDVEFHDHFFAVTANPVNAEANGVDKDRIIVFPEWVGGRYSVWSSVSLSVALVLGRNKFEEFLDGAALVDKHFLTTELDKSPIFVAAVLDHCYANYFDAGSRAIFAYDYRLRTLVPYLQQLETESNGKDRDIDGNPVQVKTSVAVWGGTGTGMQHSTFQLLHQGTQFIPVELILVKTADHDLDNHHRKLLANGLAQSAAFLTGRNYEQVSEMPENSKSSDTVNKSKVFAGEKPSTTIVLNSLSPHSLGGLLSFYEHRTFCGGVLANINSFDQMGVELGKQLAIALEPFLNKTSSKELAEQNDFDSSTMKLINLINAAGGSYFDC